MLQGSTSVRQEDAGTVQGRMVRRRVRRVVQQDVLLFRNHRQVKHHRSEQTSQHHRQGSVPGGAHQPSERRWNEPWVPGASLDRDDVRARTSSSHLLLRQTRGVRGRTEHGSGGRVDKATRSDRLS